MSTYIFATIDNSVWLPLVSLTILWQCTGGVVWRVKCSDRKLVCAVGSRNGIEDTKLLVLDFDVY